MFLSLGSRVFKMIRYAGKLSSFFTQPCDDLKRRIAPGIFLVVSIDCEVELVEIVGCVHTVLCGSAVSEIDFVSSYHVERKTPGLRHGDRSESFWGVMGRVLAWLYTSVTMTVWKHHKTK